MSKKYIFVMGANISGLGKGCASASIAKLLKQQGYNISQCKIDGYLNCDAGVLSPLEHGETFVTVDGGEIDLDFGSYERFTNENLTKESSITSGKIFTEMLKLERQGEFLGKTVQLTPHYTDYINNKIVNIAENKNADISIIEVGGTIGDAESQMFVEAARQIRNKVGKENVMYVLLTYIPFLKASKELKTKLTQQAVTQLRSYGINPDMLICRTERKLNQEIKDKIARMCDVEPELVIEGIDVDSIYKIPIKFQEQKMDKKICGHLGLSYNVTNDIIKWKELVQKMEHPKKETTIAIVGKYVELHDSYLSVMESLRIAGAHLDTKVNIKWIDSEDIENYREFSYKAAEQGNNMITYGKNYFDDVDGVVVPGGFGYRGIEGKILAAKYCRENNIPYLGICLGMQIAAIEFARYKLGYLDATSEEFDETNSSTNHVIHLMESQKGVSNKGGTMRLGNYKCNILNKDSNTYKCYNSDIIERRHRHRYEFNDIYRKEFSDNGMDIVGINPDNNLVEIIELKNHPFYVGAQYHPEFNTRFIAPEQLFTGLIIAALKEK